MFYDKARCLDCHGGRVQTDRKFHAAITAPRGPCNGGDCNNPDHLGAIMFRPESVRQIVTANEVVPTQLNEVEIDQLIDLLQALTEPDSLDLRRDASECSERPVNERLSSATPGRNRTVWQIW